MPNARARLPPTMRRNPFFFATAGQRKEVAEGYRDASTLKYSYTPGSITGGAALELKSRLGRGRPVGFFDWGAGKGGGIEQAKLIGTPLSREQTGAPANLRTVGLSLSRNTNPFIPKERWVRGSFERTVLPESHDVSQSTFSLRHAANHAIALENMLNSLKKGGTMVMANRELMLFAEHALDLEVPRTKKELAEWEKVLKTLEAQGFKVTRQDPKDYVDYKHWDNSKPLWLDSEMTITREGGPADLSEYYSSNTINKIPLHRPEVHFVGAGRKAKEAARSFRRFLEDHGLDKDVMITHGTRPLAARTPMALTHVVAVGRRHAQRLDANNAPKTAAHLHDIARLGRLGKKGDWRAALLRRMKQAARQREA